MRLRDRMTKLEAAFEPETPSVIVMKTFDGESYETALARHETEYRPINDPSGKAIKVLIRQLA